jgi:RNA polymerase sigma-70 factor (TIGR02943 family)
MPPFSSEYPPAKKPDSEFTNAPSRVLNPEQWVDDHGNSLYRYALVRVRRAEVAEDLVQETLCAAHARHQSFRGPSSERSWLFGILRNKICDHFRKLGREVSFTDLEFLQNEMSNQFDESGHWRVDEGPKEWKPEPDVIMNRAEFWEMLRACLSKLPKRVGDVFMLREMEGLESSEICQDLRISENNLWVMLHRARMALRECVELNWFKVESGEKADERRR